MASITATGAGNWSSTTPDAPWPSGTVPSDGDTVSAGAYGVNIDVTTIGSSGTPMAELTATTGYFDFGNSMTGACTVYATKMTAGTVGNTGTFRHTATTAGYSLTIYTGTGTNGLIGATSGTNPYAFVKTSTQNFTFYGDAKGGSCTGSTAMYINNATGTNTLEGNFTGGSVGNTSRCVTINTNSTVNINYNGQDKTITGGSGTYSCEAIFSSQNTPTVNIYNSTITAGSVLNNAIQLTGSTPTFTLSSNCILVNSASTFPIAGRLPTWNPDASTYYNWGSFRLAKEVDAANLLENVSNGMVTGTYASPATTDVKDGVMFGPSSTLEGEYTEMQLTDVLEGAVTVGDALRLLMATAINKSSGLQTGAGTVTVRDYADTKNRIVIGYDANGNRTTITTIDGT